MTTKQKEILYCRPANTEKVHELKADEFLEDKTFSCPPFDGCLWSSHPRVFLTLNDKDEVICPYCATLYTLNKQRAHQ